MTLLLSLGNQLVPVEASVLSALKAAAEGGEYWNTLSRLRGSIPDLDVILLNISIKARGAGMVPQLERLRDDQAMEDGA